MKLSFRAYLALAEQAASFERDEEFDLAAGKWRTAYHISPNKTQGDWSYTRAEYCFKRAIEEGLIAVQETRQLDFKRFMEVEHV